MSEAVLDQVIERIADGSSVDWAAINGGTLVGGDNQWLACLRIIDDVANLHRADALNLMTEMPTAVATPMPGVSAGVPDVWGKYRLANRVGAGSYGAVYRAWDSDLERDVAMKILHDRFGDTRLKEKLLKEGRALARIRHHNVVQVFGVESHGDRVALCMEFVQGQTLDELVLRQRRLSAREAVGIGEDLCRALAAVHAAGYIHRDVKAKNVMRDEKGRIVLMDFGTGRQADNPAALGDRAGTPLYMAPEVLEGEPASAASDVYSLGVLLYHLVTAQYPVEARTVDDLRDAHRHRRHRWLSERRPDLPVPFMQVIEKAIALDPEERYANPSELLAALGALKVGPHPWVWRLAKPAIAVAILLTGMTLLGALTSAAFNITLQRSEFANETFRDYLTWGRRTSFMPTMILAFTLLVATLFSVFRRLVLAVSVAARRLDAIVRLRARAFAHRHRLDEVSVLASFALLVSAFTVAVAWWYYSPLLLAILSYISTSSSEQLALLSPSAVEYHNRYRQVFSVVTIISVAVWYPVARLIRKGQSPHWGYLVGGVLSTCLTLALLHIPYRLMYFNKSFEAVSLSDSRCYVIGDRNDERLLFCPDLAPPRNRTVALNDPRVTPLGIRESIFTRFGTAVR